MKAYRIRDWKKHFENNRTRELKKMDWVPVPNKHDGEGYLTIMGEKDGMIIYAAWHLILQVASKCEPRGTLLRDSGTPHTARSIALKTGCRDENAIQLALDFCSSPQVAWIEVFETNPAPACVNPAPACVEGKGMEGNGIGIEEKEEKGRVESHPQRVLKFEAPPPDAKHGPRYVAMMTEVCNTPLSLPYRDWLQVFVSYGMPVNDETVAGVTSNLKLRPAHEWEKHGNKLLAFAIQDFGKTYGKKVAPAHETFDEIRARLKHEEESRK